jgi:hypothetical protein
LAANDATAAIPHRVGVLEKRADVHANQIDQLQADKAEKADLEKLAGKLDDLRKVLVGMTITIAVAAIVFALSVLQFVLTTGGLK